MKNIKRTALLLLASVSFLGSCNSSDEITSNNPTTEPPTTTTTTTENITPSTSVETPVSSTSTTTNPPISTPVDTNNYVEIDEFLERITSVYSYDMTAKEEMGLSSAKNVGIDEEKFKSEVKFNVPSEGTVYIAEDYGITTTAENNSGTLSILLSNIKSVEGNKIIKFKGETYPFGATVDVTGIKDLYLVGEEGTTFLYSGWNTYFKALISENVNIYNITFDMKYSPTIGGTITNVEEKSGKSVITVSIPEEFDLSHALYQNWRGTTGSYMEYLYDEETASYIPNLNGNLMYNSPTSAQYQGILGVSYRSSSKELDITINHNFPYCSYKKPAIGTRISLAYTMYENHGFYFLDCDNVNFENVNVHVTGGMGFRVERGSNFNLNRTNFMLKEDSSRLMTCTADIIHTIALQGALNITNSILEASHDDALNIKTFYTKITSVSAAAREISVAQTQSECSIPFEVGDTIDIYNPDTMAFIDSYTIKELVKQGTAYTFTVDRRPNRDIAGFNCGNATRVTEMNLNNSIIRNKRNRGILLQSRKSNITNCIFQNVVMGAIQVLSVTDSFREAIVPQDITIENCKFISNSEDISVFAYGSNGQASSVAGTIKGITITNNLFYNTIYRSMWLLAVGDANITNNLYYYPSKNAATKVKMETSSNITFENNVLYSPNHDSITFYDYSVCEGLSLNNNIKKG